jgi:hypothetical protein
MAWPRHTAFAVIIMRTVTDARSASGRVFVPDRTVSRRSVYMPTAWVGGWHRPGCDEKGSNPECSDCPLCIYGQ